MVRTLTQQELCDAARERFGDDPKAWAFVCPACGDIASAQDFIDAGADPVAIGQHCIGRELGALAKPPTHTRGCDWAAYGLFGGPWTIVLPAEGDKPERTARSFALAPDPSYVDTVKKGDRLTWSGVSMQVTRVSTTGAWADVACSDGERTWTKRQQMPFPKGTKRAGGAR